MPGVRNVVLVHGAWADGYSRSKVIPLPKASQPQKVAEFLHRGCRLGWGASAAAAK